MPVLAGFNSGEIRSLRFLLPPPPADAAAYEAEIRAALRRSRRRIPARSIRPDDLEESMLAADARRALRLDRRAAGPQRRRRSASPPSSICFDHGYPAADAARPARLPRRRNALCLRHDATDAAALAEGPRQTATEARADRRDASTIGRASRGPAQPTATGQPAWRPYGDEPRLYATSPTGAAAGGTICCPACTSSTRRWCAAARRPGDIAMELECRHRLRRRCPPERRECR